MKQKRNIIKRPSNSVIVLENEAIEDLIKQLERDKPYIADEESKDT